MKIHAHERIIAALDGMTMTEASNLTAKLVGRVWGVKMNTLLHASTPGGVPPVTLIKHYGLRVFADPKFHDIPQTVADGVAELARQGADLITVHASGGPDMIRAAVEAYDRYRPAQGLGILVVTVLTSISEDLCYELYAESPADAVLQFAEFAKDAGAYGIVCSPKELAALRGRFPTLKRVTPGVRSLGKATHDQARFGTPSSAIRDGADLLVVGRQLTQAADLSIALTELAAEIATSERV